MALSVFQRTIVTDTGDVISGADLEVREGGSTGPLATIYSDADGTTELPNPFSADSEGFARFYAAGGAYWIQASGAGATLVWEDVQLGTAQSKDTGQGDTQLPSNNDIRDYYKIGFRAPVLPTISSNFARNNHELYEPFGNEPKSLTDIWTFTRASTATYVDATGIIREAAEDTPRVTYDPDTGESLGLLVEEQRTNLLTYSEDFTQADWLQFGSSFWDKSISNKQSPIEGVNYGEFYVPEDVSSETSLYHQSPATSPGSMYTFSFFVSKDYQGLRYCQIDGRNGERSSFDIETGEFAETSSSHTSGVKDWRDSWLVWITVEAVDTSERFGVMPYESGSISYSKDFTAGSYQYTTGFQVEESPSPTSYIPTTSSQVTREADEVVRTLGDGEFNSEQGTYFVHAIAPKYDYFNCALGAGGENNEEFRIGIESETTQFSARAGGSERAPKGNPYSVGDVLKLALSYKKNNDGSYTVKTCDRGEMAESSTLPSLPNNAEQIGVGSRAHSNGLFWDESIQAARYYPRALSAAELEEMTK